MSKSPHILVVDDDPTHRDLVCEILRPLGFAVAGEIGGIFWLSELSVDPAAMRQGIGSALVEAVAAHAGAAGFARLGLSTFRDIPFNAPFYARRGFVAADPAAMPRAVCERFAAELPDGAVLDDRVLMLRKL